MTTMSLTEFNQNPSRVVRLLEDNPSTVIRVQKRGVPILQVTAIPQTPDPIAALIARGLATPAANPSSTPVDYGDRSVPPGIDLLAELARDRNRLG